MIISSVSSQLLGSLDGCDHYTEQYQLHNTVMPDQQWFPQHQETPCFLVLSYVSLCFNWIREAGAPNDCFL